MNITEPIVGVPLSILDSLCSKWELDPETKKIRVIGPKTREHEFPNYSSCDDLNGKGLSDLADRKLPTGSRPSRKRKLNNDGENEVDIGTSYKKKRTENSSASEKEEEAESEDASDEETYNNTTSKQNGDSEENESTDYDYSKFYPKQSRLQLDTEKHDKLESSKRKQNQTMDLEKLRRKRRSAKGEIDTSSRNNIFTSDVYRQRKKDALNSGISKRRKSRQKNYFTLDLSTDGEEESSDEYKAYHRRAKRKQLLRYIRRLQRKKQRRQFKSRKRILSSDSEFERKALGKKLKKSTKRIRIPSSSDEESKLTVPRKKVKSSAKSSNDKKQNEASGANSDDSKRSDISKNEIKDKSNARESSADYVPGQPVSFKSGFWKR